MGKYFNYFNGFADKTCLRFIFFTWMKIVKWRSELFGGFLKENAGKWEGNYKRMIKQFLT